MCNCIICLRLLVHLVLIDYGVAGDLEPILSSTEYNKEEHHIHRWAQIPTYSHSEPCSVSPTAELVQKERSTVKLVCKLLIPMDNALGSPDCQVRSVFRSTLLAFVFSADRPLDDVCQTYNLESIQCSGWET